jgi:hypothetical protein
VSAFVVLALNGRDPRATAEGLRTTNMPSLEQALAASRGRDKAAQPPEPVAAR